MRFCNLNTGYTTNKLPRIPNALNTTWDNAKEHYIALGWREYESFVIPEGKTIIPNTSVSYIQDENDPSKAIEFYETETPEEKDARIIIDEEVRQNNKSIELKTAENNFLDLVLYANMTYGLDIQTTDGFQDIAAKIDVSTMERIDKIDLGLKLRTLWDVVLYHGGRWGDVTYHTL